MRLIDAESYIKYCDDHWIPLNVDAVLAQPTIDAVPVVRCKDCKYARMTYAGECKYCDIWFPDEAVYIDGDSFCSSAERKEE